MTPCLVPGQMFLDKDVPYFLLNGADEIDAAYILGVVSSVPFDWFIRHYVDRFMTLDAVLSSPLPRPARDDAMFLAIAGLAGRLSCQDERYSPFARAIGVECAIIPKGDRVDMTAQIDACVACLYGLTRDHVIHIFETMHRSADSAPHLSRVLKHYDSMKDTG